MMQSINESVVQVARGAFYATDLWSSFAPRTSKPPPVRKGKPYEAVGSNIAATHEHTQRHTIVKLGPRALLCPLARGGLATYIAPIECRAARKVVYAVVLGEDGAPTSAPMPVGDASSFAVTTQGEKVDLWIQRDDDVVWIRATCAAP